VRWVLEYWARHHPDGGPGWLRPRLRPATALWLWPLLLVALMIFATEGQPIVSWIARMYTGGN
jgi:hypothetical protein